MQTGWSPIYPACHFCSQTKSRILYTVMQWDEKSKYWYGVEYCETPEDLRDELLSSYRMNEAEKITKTKRELTEEEAQAVNINCRKLLVLCK